MEYGVDNGQVVDTRQRAIASIHVRGLLGKFDYDLQLATLDGPTLASRHETLFAVNEARLTLLYGGNGTGKTSLLKLLFHALSPAHNRNHRTAMSGVKFAEFRVQLVSGDWVAYQRGPSPDEGPMVVETSVDGRSARWDFFPGPRREEEETGEHEVLSAIRALGVNPTFLSDSRAFHSDLIEREDLDERMLAYRGARVEDIVSQRRDADLQSALQRVRSYLADLVFRGAQAGSQRVDTVYVNLAKAIVAHTGHVGRPKKATIPALRARIETVGERARPFTTYELIPEFPAGALLNSLSNAQDRNGPLLEHVLTPYLDGLVQRMDALDPGLRAISTYVSTVNSFFEGKALRFSLGLPFGLIVDHVTGEDLDPGELSSGEKQILLLVSNLIAMREASRLFIVDEPELSLNPGWQRNLMPALLAVTSDSPMQLCAATHSIEIMARFRDRMRHLAPE